MSTDTTVSPLRQRMIEDMAARKLGPARREATSVAASGSRPSWALARDGDSRRYPAASSCTWSRAALSIPNRNRIMTGVKFLFRVTLRRHDLAAEIYHIKEPQKLPLVMSPDEVKRLLAMAGTQGPRLLALGYGCGLRAARSSGSRSATSTARRGSSASCRPRGARTATSCCRRRCSRCCGNGGRRVRRATMPACRQQERWLFPGHRPGQHLTTRQLNRLFHETADAAGIKKRSPCTRCATASQPICSSAAPTFGRSRRCSDIQSWRRRRATRAWPRA